MLTRSGAVWAWIKLVLAVLGVTAVVLGMTDFGLVIFGGVLEVTVLLVMAAAAWFAIFPKELERKFPGFSHRAQAVSDILLAFAILFGMVIVAWSFLI